MPVARLRKPGGAAGRVLSGPTTGSRIEGSKKQVDTNSWQQWLSVGLALNVSCQET